MATSARPEPDFEWPPTQDELPSDDGEPLETWRHWLQIAILIQSLRLHWAERRNWFIAGNMFVYFSLAQIRNQDFRGPDVFVVLDVADITERERKSWVVWEEGKAPDVVIELLSESTAAFDKTEKKRIYQDQMRVPEYYWYDVFTGELAGFALRDGRYEPLQPDAQGRLRSEVLDLLLVSRESTVAGVTAPWLRWATPDGAILPDPEELAAQQQARAEQEQAHAEEERARAEQERLRAEEALRRVAELEALLGRDRPAPDNEPA